MIIDTLPNAEKYFPLHPLFSKAFKFIDSINLEELGVGEYEIEDTNLRAIASDKPGLSARDSKNKMECHNEHIDIQLCLNGKEKIGWKSRHACALSKEKYDPNNDVLFFDDMPDIYLQLRKNQFAIFFPDDVHKPMIGKGNIKKLVIKVKI